MLEQCTHRGQRKSAWPCFRQLDHSRSWWSNRRTSASNVHSSWHAVAIHDRGHAIGVDSGLWTLSADMATFTTTVAGLAGAVQWSTIWSCAVTRNVPKLTTSIALHSLSLAITGEVVWTTALVAESRTVVACEPTTEAAAVTATRSSSSASSSARSWRSTSGWAIAREMANLAARIAASTALGTAAQSKSWAVSLDVTEALTVIALLCLGRPWVRAVVALVTRLLAVITQPLAAGAHFGIMPNISALVARPSAQRRHPALSVESFVGPMKQLPSQEDLSVLLHRLSSLPCRQ